MGEEEKHLLHHHHHHHIPPVDGKTELPPNSSRTAVHHTAGAAAIGRAPPPTPTRFVLPRSRLAPSVPSQQPIPCPEMVPGDAASGGGGGSRGQLCWMACGAALSLALIVVGILLCLAPLYLHGGGGSGALVMLLGCLGLLLVVLGLIGMFLSFIGLGGSSSSSSRAASSIHVSTVKQPLLGGRRGSARVGSTMAVVVE